MKNRIGHYDGNIMQPICRGHISINRLIGAILDPSPEIKELLDKIAIASAIGDKELKMYLKRGLHYFTPTAIIPKGKPRRYENIEGFNEIMVLDFDDEPRASDLIAYLWATYPELIAVWLSPSKRGVKGLIRIPIVDTIEQYKEYFRGFQKAIEDSGIDTLDNCSINPIQPLYISHDPSILWRDNPKIWDTKLIRSVEHINTVAPEIVIEGDETVYKSQAYYQRITIDIFIKKIRDIVGEPGHTRFRDACLQLGSRSGAGYISKSDALSLAQHELNQNTYLQKNLRGYWETGRSRIEMGFNNPIYYN